MLLLLLLHAVPLPARAEAARLMNGSSTRAYWSHPIANGCPGLLGYATKVKRSERSRVTSRTYACRTRTYRYFRARRDRNEIEVDRFDFVEVTSRY